MNETRKKKIKAFFKDEANLFVIQLVAIYAAWKVVHYLLLNTNQGVARWWKSVVRGLGEIYAATVSAILNLFGENTVHRGIAIVYPDKSKYITVEEHCLAIPATVIFVSCILLFKGSWKNKLWFIPMGVMAVVLINLTRLIFLCETFVYFSKAFFNINHSFVYVVITYALIMVLIVWWIKSFGNLKPRAAQIPKV